LSELGIVDRTRVKHLLGLAGYNLSDLAVELSCSVGFLSNVCAGRRRSKDLQKAISEKVNKPVSELWPCQQTKQARRVARITDQPAQEGSVNKGP
jgi:hypothetical protein